MSVAGPSRMGPSRPFAPKTENTYEQDLLKLLDQYSLEERDEFQMSLRRRISAGGRLSDRDIALNDLIQQARQLDAFNQDRILAERIAVEEDSDVGVDAPEMPTVQTLNIVPQPKRKRTRTKRKKKSRQQQEDVDQSPVQTLAPPLPDKEMTETRQMENQQPSSIKMSVWAKGPPPGFNVKGKETEQTGNHPMSAWTRGFPHLSNAKGKEPCWKTGETPPSSTPLVFGSQPSIQPTPTDIRVLPKAPIIKRPTGHDCVICQDPIYGVEIRAPCGHYYDISCITDLFKSATKDESLFPPRCCKQNIPFESVQTHLSQMVIATFQEKKTEFGTLKRVYCWFPTCSQFLGPLSEDDSASSVYTCPAKGCGKKTCGKCREQYGGNWVHICRPDAGATQVLELSSASGWSRCPGCSQMIELNTGCFHMTCRCRTEFCYLCRMRWKTCSCPQWDEDRLVAVAEGRVDAQLGMGRERGVRDDGGWQRAGPPPAVRNPFAILDEQPANPAQTAPRRLQWQDISKLFQEPANTTMPRRTPTNTDTFGSPSSSSSISQWISDEENEYVPQFASSVNDPGIRERLIREMVERLRVDHDCDHTHWGYQDDGGLCESCGDYLPLYLFRCRGCDMLACNRCRRNRL